MSIGEPVIQLENVCYRTSDRDILLDISFDVARGEILSLMGMSGSGKTTLLKCLGALIKPTSGRIWMEGAEITHLRETELDRIRLRIGFVFQYAALFDSLTVFENVAFGLQHHRRMPPDELRETVAKLLAEVGLEGTEGLYPSELSGGMQKRVGLARALAMQPSILLYDEPTSGLDPVIGRTIDDLIVRTRDRFQVTSVVVSHHIETVFRISDRIAMLEGGRLLTVGSPDELRNSDLPQVRRFLYGDMPERGAQTAAAAR